MISPGTARPAREFFNSTSTQYRSYFGNYSNPPLPAQKISSTTHEAFDGLTLRCHSYKICLFFPNSQVHDCKHTSLIKKK